MKDLKFDEAREFLDEINITDSVIVIHHDDLDGFTSGTFFYNWCEGRSKNVKHLAFSYGQILNDKDFEGFNKVIITDLSDKGIVELMSLLDEKEVFYCDHHPKIIEFGENVKRYDKNVEGYVPCSRLAQELVGLNHFLGVIGVLGDKGDLYEENKEYIGEFLNKEGLELEDFKKEFVYVLSNAICYFNKEPDTFFEEFRKINEVEDVDNIRKYSDLIEEEIFLMQEKYEKEKEVYHNVILFYFEPVHNIKGPLIQRICEGDKENVFIFVNPSSKDSEVLKLSSRANFDEVDLPDLLGKVLADLEGASFGGHKRASGGQFMKKDLDKFRKRLERFGKELKRTKK